MGVTVGRRLALLSVPLGYASLLSEQGQPVPLANDLQLFSFRWQSLFKTGWQWTDNTLKADGIGPVRLGAVINSLPKSSEGLYDRIEPERVEEFDYEGTVYHLVQQAERIVTLIEDNGKIHAIEVYSDKVQTEDGFGLNKTAVQILSAGGTSYCDNYGFEGLLYKGMLFSGMDLTPSGQKKAEDAYLDGTDQVFTESDFITGTHPVKITLTKWYAEAAK